MRSQKLRGGRDARPHVLQQRILGQGPSCQSFDAVAQSHVSGKHAGLQNASPALVLRRRHLEHATDLFELRRHLLRDVGISPRRRRPCAAFEREALVKELLHQLCGGRNDLIADLRKARVALPLGQPVHGAGHAPLRASLLGPVVTHLSLDVFHPQGSCVPDQLPVRQLAIRLDGQQQAPSAHLHVRWTCLPVDQSAPPAVRLQLLQHPRKVDQEPLPNVALRAVPSHGKQARVRQEVGKMHRRGQGGQDRLARLGALGGRVVEAPHCAARIQIRSRQQHLAIHFIGVHERRLGEHAVHQEAEILPGHIGIAIAQRRDAFLGPVRKRRADGVRVARHQSQDIPQPRHGRQERLQHALRVHGGLKSALPSPPGLACALVRVEPGRLQLGKRHQDADERVRRLMRAASVLHGEAGSHVRVLGKQLAQRRHAPMQHEAGGHVPEGHPAGKLLRLRVIGEHRQLGLSLAREEAHRLLQKLRLQQRFRHQMRHEPVQHVGHWERMLRHHEHLASMPHAQTDAQQFDLELSRRA
eukprot:scaffold1220_cov259-Pinguiococcus_pyrenoidosus.AAC.137